ncbi:MAG: hypothetical protein AB7K71_01315 [Polyangiaceae bacterium]
MKSVAAKSGVLLGAGLVLVGFFMAWFGFSFGPASISISGWQIAKVASQRGAQYYAIYLLPLGALIAGFLALTNRRGAAKVALLVGGVFLLWSLAEVLLLLWRTTFLGLWLTLLGAGVLFFAGLLAKRR